MTPTATPNRPRRTAQAIAREPGTGDRFGAAVANLRPADREDLRLTIEGTLEEQPQFTPFQALNA